MRAFTHVDFRKESLVPLNHFEGVPYSKKTRKLRFQDGQAMHRQRCWKPKVGVSVWVREPQRTLRQRTKAVRNLTETSPCLSKQQDSRSNPRQQETSRYDRFNVPPIQLGPRSCKSADSICFTHRTHSVLNRPSHDRGSMGSNTGTNYNSARTPD